MDKRSRVAIEIIPIERVKPRFWDEIWGLTQRFYETTREYAELSLKQRQHLVLFRERDTCALIGMASMDLFPVAFDGRKRVVIYTAHVLLLEAYRGHNLLQKVGFRAFVSARLRYPLRSIYWFFDTFSYKSYLLLPRNFQEFWPRYDQRTPTKHEILIDTIAKEVYGDAWRPTQGIVVRSGQKRLKPGTAPLEALSMRTPELEFFARVNPGHAEGDMLVCLCPLTLPNWLHLAHRAIQRGRKSPR